MKNILLLKKYQITYRSSNLHEVSIFADENVILKLGGQVTIQLEAESLAEVKITAVNSGGCHGV